MNNNETIKNKIKDYLCDMNSLELLNAWNEYASENYYNTIFTCDEFDEICENMTASEIALKCFNGKHFNPNDEFFTFNGYENFESSDDLNDLIDIDELADFIVDNDNDLYNDNIRNILDDEDDEE